MRDLDKEVPVTESEGTMESGSSSSSGSASTPRRKRTSTRRKTGASRRKTAAGGRKPGARTATSSGRKTSSRRRRRSSREAGLQSFLNDLAKRANVAGSKIAEFSEEGADAARKTIGKVSASSRQTIARVRREWDRMDSTRKAQFVAGLLGALAAAAAGVRKATRK
jgi:hypothetical protein